MNPKTSQNIQNYESRKISSREIHCKKKINLSQEFVAARNP